MRLLTEGFADMPIAEESITKNAVKNVSKETAMEPIKETMSSQPTSTVPTEVSPPVTKPNEWLLGGFLANFFEAISELPLVISIREAFDKFDNIYGQSFSEFFAKYGAPVFYLHTILFFVLYLVTKNRAMIIFTFVFLIGSIVVTILRDHPEKSFATVLLYIVCIVVGLVFSMVSAVASLIPSGKNSGEVKAESAANTKKNTANTTSNVKNNAKPKATTEVSAESAEPKKGFFDTIFEKVKSLRETKVDQTNSMKGENSSDQISKKRNGNKNAGNQNRVVSKGVENKGNSTQNRESNRELDIEEIERMNRPIESPSLNELRATSNTKGGKKRTKRTKH